MKFYINVYYILIFIIKTKDLLLNKSEETSRSVLL